MTSAESGLAYRRLRAPTDHGLALLEPRLDELPSLVELNRRRDIDRIRLLDQPLKQLAQQARRQLLGLARNYSNAYLPASGAAAELDPAAPILLSGHQPDLFHTGVWFKNFVLSAAAARVGGVAINLTVDVDLCRTTSVNAPRLVGGLVDFDTVPFDEQLQPQPLESRRIGDLGLFGKFGAAVGERASTYAADPVIGHLWPYAVELGRAGRPLGQCFAAARHLVEFQLGLRTLELPVSKLADSDSFRWFVADMLERADDFLTVHNESLRVYRRVNRVRSRSHPAPALERLSEKVETPFWVWSADAPRRRRLFVSTSAASWTLSDENNWSVSIEIDGRGKGESIVAQLTELAREGLRIRPRAFATTLFARLFCCDLFLHGIGGAKYDQLTDELMRRFYGAPAPALAVATCTMHLPLPTTPTTAADVREIERKIRDLRFRPECGLPKDIKRIAEVADLLETKRRWVEMQPPRGAGKARREKLVEINQLLQRYVDEPRAGLLRSADEAREQVRANRRLRSREYSFCVHDMSTLTPRLLELSEKGS
ncbi:MAG: hypothetical protein QGG36_25955 [Pirellulaceae bacterium]|jgi:hypothetical protein|nr:hypothetical protein [Pirellulaceae bacterium]MDP7019268.1 hypothetical protein [Pirellulaceae bacterium]